LGFFAVNAFKQFFALLFAQYCNALFAGTLFGYILYDLTHYFIHHESPYFEYYKSLKKYHIMHHYINPHLGYGVSNKFWDYVFRTVLKDKENKKNK